MARVWLARALALLVAHDVAAIVLLVDALALDVGRLRALVVLDPIAPALIGVAVPR
jgi:hypothetical protein